MSSTVFYNDAAELATLTNTFSLSGVNTDPSTVSLVVADPTGAATTYTYSPGTITRTGTGVYTLSVSCSASISGVWSYEWIGTGAVSDVASGNWTVEPLTSAQLYCTTEELKSRLGITDTSDDFEIHLAVDAACRSIDEITGRYFWRGTGTRTYIPENIYYQTIDDLVSVTSVNVDRDGDGVYEEPWTLGTDYQLQVALGKFNVAAKGEAWPYTAFSIVGPKFIPVTWPWSHLDRIQVNGVFGWPSVPPAVKQAALIAAADLFKIKDAPFGVAGFGEFGAVKITANPRVLSLLRRYITGDRVGV